MSSARACANIALVKYWGKRDRALNLPARGSLSLTLAALTTRTTVELAEADGFSLDGVPAEVAPITAFLELVRALAGRREHALVQSHNDFPTGSGLASSASGFAALALAATRAYGLELSPVELSLLARRGSGSAARSIFGGFVAMAAGSRADGSDAHATQLAPPEHWDLRMVIAVIGDGSKKAVASRLGMDHTAATSPLHQGWLDTVDGDLHTARLAIAARDLEALGTVTEQSCLAMHADAMAARPGVIYFAGATIDALHAIRALRATGVPCWATCDAGPHVKVLTTPTSAATVAATLAPFASRTIISALGPGVCDG
jgi:diphosphomevalonate decarboxylase